MLCRSIAVGALGLLATLGSSRAEACDRAVVTAVIVPQAAVVSPFVVLPQVVVPTVVAVPQVQRVKVIQPRHARTVVRTRTVIR
jgi:hypothetical protein